MRRILALAALTAGAALAADEKVTVEPYQLVVERRLGGKAFVFRNDTTRVEFRASFMAKQVIGVSKDSRVTTFADDKGNSLIVSGGVNPTRFHHYSPVAKDRRSVLVQVASFGKVPAKGSTKVVLKGDLVVRCGADERTKEVKVEFKEKNEVKVAELTLRVEKEKGPSGGPNVELVGPYRGVKAITFTDPDGIQRVALPTGGYDLDPVKHTQRYQLTQPLTEGKVKVTYYAKEESVKVPVDLIFTPGL